MNLVFTLYTPQQLWLRQYFGIDWNNPAVAAKPAAPDNDGSSNLTERALGMNPTLSDAVAWKPGTPGLPVQATTNLAG